MYIAYTHEILEVAHAEFSAIYGQTDVAYNDPQARVGLFTIQHLAEHISAWRSHDVDYVVIDEFHHAAAKTYRKVIETLRFTFLLGLTATPLRADRQDILKLCDNNVIMNCELRTEVEAGILSPYHYYGCFDETDYRDLYARGKRYSVRDLERKLIVKERHEAVVQKWVERAENKPTLAFCCTHLHAKRVAEAFAAQRISSDVYVSTTSQQERRRLIAQLERGELKVLCVVDVLNEGADIRFIECLLFLQPTEIQSAFFFNSSAAACVGTSGRHIV